MNQIKPNDTSRIFNAVVSVFASGLTLGGIALGGWYIMYYRNHEQTNDAQIEQYVTPVMSRVTGYVKAVNYQDNSFVHKGDTLIQLDEREYRAKLDMAYADFENALKNENVITKSTNNAKQCGYSSGTIECIESQSLGNGKRVSTSAQFVERGGYD
jgi:membrane fusion protein (multidrug efflux system)